jgi:hypothetical protein
MAESKYVDGASDMACVFAEAYGPLIGAVREMRTHQRAFFEAKRRGVHDARALDAARKAEREVDRLLADHDRSPPAQGSLPL